MLPNIKGDRHREAVVAELAAVAEDKEMSNKSQSAAWKESSSHLPHICPFFYQKFFCLLQFFGVWLRDELELISYSSHFSPLPLLLYDFPPFLRSLLCFALSQYSFCVIPMGAPRLIKEELSPAKENWKRGRMTKLLWQSLRWPRLEEHSLRFSSVSTLVGSNQLPLLRDRPLHLLHRVRWWRKVLGQPLLKWGRRRQTWMLARRRMVTRSLTPTMWWRRSCLKRGGFCAPLLSLPSLRGKSTLQEKPGCQGY